MAIFKNKYTHGSMFTCAGVQYKVPGWEIETKDEVVINFLKNNRNWIEVSKSSEPQEQNSPVNSPVDSKVDYSKLSVAKLKELAIEKNLEIPEDADKKELIALLNK